MNPGFFALGSPLEGPQNFLSKWTDVSSGFAGMSLMVWAILGVVAVIIAWAVFIRKPEDERHRRHHWRDRYPRRRRSGSRDSHGKNSGAHDSEPGQGPEREHEHENENGAGHNHSHSHSHGHRRRRRRHRDRPRNPTLAETGGLPPPRDDNAASGSP